MSVARLQASTVPCTSSHKLRAIRTAVLWSAVTCLATLQAPAQAPASQPQNQQPTYALRIQSRLVVEDVSVLDRQGKAVTGLPPSAFHVYDNKQPQTLQSVLENTAPTASLPLQQRPGTFSNADLYRNQGNVAVLLIDPSTISLEDQLAVRVQADKFVQNASPDTAMAVFRVNSAGVPVLLQPLTNNKAQLDAAIAASIPVLTRPIDSAFRNAVIELANISSYLRAVPGRKSVLWLAGAFPLYLPPDYGGLCDYPQGASCGALPTGPRLKAQQDAYRDLQEARVAVYPIDVRGVQMGGLTAVPVLDRGPNVTPGNIGAKPTSESERVTGQYDEMDRLAEATGGHAFYSGNHVAALLDQALQRTSQSYTLTYRPTDEAADGKWHSVKITVDGPYSVHYRAGYYADQTPSTPASSPHRVLTAEQTSPATLSGPAAPADPDTEVKPIVFSARVLSDGVPGKAREVKIRYVIPADQLLFDGEPSGHAHFQLAALAYNANGDILSNDLEVVNTHYTAEQIKVAQRIGAPADQTVSVAKGANYLLLAVEDLATRRVGVVQLPLRQVPQGSEAHP